MANSQPGPPDTLTPSLIEGAARLSPILGESKRYGAFSVCRNCGELRAEHRMLVYCPDKSGREFEKNNELSKLVKNCLKLAEIE